MSGGGIDVDPTPMDQPQHPEPQPNEAIPIDDDEALSEVESDKREDDAQGREGGVVPCAAPMRGKNDTYYPPKAGTQRDPCGRPIVSTLGGVNVAAQNLCLFHMGLKRGLADMPTPIVLGA